ncbi:uncharacterized protein LOC135168189 isoform X1 [Diachasmimorpha longicaudata]|uniref:uncharacterized protein LOC135168189 isoform X1 n=1 Tax=Diachasmimorpha longicaudata TaxID=58733 RepID=UPI0030B8D93F
MNYRLAESGLKFKRRAQDKIGSMMRGSGYKRKRKSLPSHKLTGRRSAKTCKSRKNKKKRAIANKNSVYPADCVSWTWPRPCAIIINTDNHNQAGSHWVAVYLGSNGRGMYFDSFGMPPFHTRISQRLKRNCNVYEWRQKRLQDMSSDVCG